METQAARIIRKFGGLTPLSQALGHKNLSTVQGWQERGFIPARRQQAVLDAAEALNVALSPADFFEPAEAAE